MCITFCGDSGAVALGVVGGAVLGVGNLVLLAGDLIYIANGVAPPSRLGVFEVFIGLLEVPAGLVALGVGLDGNHTPGDVALAVSGAIGAGFGAWFIGHGIWTVAVDRSPAPTTATAMPSVALVPTASGVQGSLRWTF